MKKLIIASMLTVGLLFGIATPACAMSKAKYHEKMSNVVVFMFGANLSVQFNDKLTDKQKEVATNKLYKKAYNAMKSLGKPADKYDSMFIDSCRLHSMYTDNKADNMMVKKYGKKAVNSMLEHVLY